MTSSEAPGDASAARSGILFIVLGLSIAALTGAFMKMLTVEHSPVLIGWFRFTGYFLIMIPFALARVGTRAFRPPRIRIQVVRGVLLCAGMLAFLTGVQTLDFADAIAILYVYPFVMTLLAPMVLGEKVSAVGWLGVIGGFGGVLLVMRPEFSNFDTGALLVLLAGCLVAMQMLLNRKLGMLSDPVVISMWGAMIASLVMLPMVPFFWKPLDTWQVGMIVLVGFTSAISQTLMVLAFARALASDLAPFTYSEIVSAVLIGLVLFGTLPDALSWAGIALITLSGLIVARTQGRTVLRRQPKL